MVNYVYLHIFCISNRVGHLSCDGLGFKQQQCSLRVFPLKCDDFRSHHPPPRPSILWRHWLLWWKPATNFNWYSPLTMISVLRSRLSSLKCVKIFFVDGCSSGSLDCDQLCYSTLTSSSCACSDGMTYDEDQQECMSSTLALNKCM